MKKTVIITGLLLIFGAIRMKAANHIPAKFTAINGNKGQRACDMQGCGHYGAGRGGRDHKGVDIITVENQELKAPFTCKIIRYGYAASDLVHQLVEIESLEPELSGITSKIMYIKPSFPVGSVVYRGHTLCLADDIKKKYGSSMTNHAHIEVYKNGKNVDPTPYII